MRKKQHVWNSGPPPHIGWWETYIAYQRARIWRWWNGSNWSFAVTPRHGAASAAKYASMRTIFTEVDIQWSDYWPENARVPRVKP